MTCTACGTDNRAAVDGLTVDAGATAVDRQAQPA